MNRKSFLIALGSLLMTGGGGGCREKSGDTGSAACDDLSGLTEGDFQLRKSLSYVEASPYSEQLCDNCQYWIAAPEGAVCGGCVTLRGPIKPKAYCSYWAPIAAV